MYKLNEIANLYIFEIAKAEKDKLSGKIVGMKERTKRDLGIFSFTFFKGQYV
jgi:hypothetical protein